MTRNTANTLPVTRNAGDYGMTNTTGTVVLRGIKIDLDSDVGTSFVIDCTRFVEGLVTAEHLKAKYQLTDDAWRQLAENDPLQQAVGQQKERRIRSGEAAREKAQALFLAAPDVLSGIVNDATASPRHRIEAIRELRQVAAVGSEANTPAADERFIININLGGEVIHFDKPLKTIEPERNQEEKDGNHERAYDRDV